MPNPNSDSSKALAAGLAILKRSKSAEGMTRQQIDEKAKALDLKTKSVSPAKMVAWLARQDEPVINGMRVECPARGRYVARKA
jgi:type II secretory pathway component PulM